MDLGNRIEFVKTCWDIIKIIGPIIRKVAKYRNIVRLVSRGASESAIPADDVVFLIGILDDPRLYLSRSNFPALRDIHESLWKIRFKLEDLEEFMIAASGENNDETRAAMFHIMSRSCCEAMPILDGLAGNPNVHDDIRDLASRVYRKLQAECLDQDDVGTTMSEAK